MNKEWMHPLKNQHFKTDKGVFRVTGHWREPRSMEVISIEYKCSQNHLHEIDVETFKKFEHRITYIEGD